MYNLLRLYVYHDGVRVGMAESADSLQWMPAFDDLGEFKLVCAATETNRALLVLDAVLYNPDTPVWPRWCWRRRPTETTTE